MWTRIFDAAVVRAMGCAATMVCAGICLCDQKYSRQVATNQASCTAIRCAEDYNSLGRVRQDILAVRRTTRLLLELGCPGIQTPYSLCFVLSAFFFKPTYIGIACHFFCGCMYHFRVAEHVKICQSASLTYTGPGLVAGHCGNIMAHTKDMYDATDEMYDVLFDGEDEICYICFSDLRRNR